MQRLLDLKEPLQADARLARHARRCATCRQSLAAHAWLVDAMARRGAAEESSVPRTLAARLAARVIASRATLASDAGGGDSPERSREAGFARRSAGRWGAIAALAAAIMLVVWSASRRAPDRPDGAAPSVAIRPLPADHLPADHSPADHSPAAGAPSNRSLAAISNPASPKPARPIDANTRRQVQLLAAETGGQLAAAARLLPGLGASHASLEAGDRSGGSGSAGSSSLKSWTDSMSDALSRWFDALPADGQAPRS